MRLVLMVEEPSMKELLNILLPKILPDNIGWLVIPHNGKGDLRASITKKLQGWLIADDKFVIVHDQDSNDCLQLKNELLLLCQNCRNDFLVRIVCVELESWFFGDLKAVSLAYGKDYTQLTAKRKFRDPDKLKNVKEEFHRLVHVHQPISGAKMIGLHMSIGNNKSHSFNTFVSGVKRICD